MSTFTDLRQHQVNDLARYKSVPSFDLGDVDDSNAAYTVHSLAIYGTIPTSLKIWLDARSAVIVDENHEVHDASDLSITYKIVSGELMAAVILDDDGTTSIGLLDSNGNVVQKIAAATMKDHSPSLNAAADNFVFVTSRTGFDRIVKSNLAGSTIDVISAGNELILDCKWSPCPITSSAGYDKIVFTTSVHGGWQLYTCNPDGTSRTRITNRTAQSYSGNDYSPSINYDGTLIAFVSNRSGTGQLWKTTISGGSPTLVISLPYEVIECSYCMKSANKLYILFTALINGAVELFVVKEDGTNLHQLTYHSGVVSSPKISVDETYVYYILNDNVSHDVYRVKFAGGKNRRVTSFGNVLDIDIRNSDIAILTVGSRTLSIIGSIGYSDLITNTTSFITKDNMQELDAVYGGSNKVFFTGQLDDGVIELFSQVGTAAPVKLTSQTSSIRYPYPYVDNSKILFSMSTDVGGFYNIYTCNPDGSSVTAVSTGTSDKMHPVPHPSVSTKILITTNNGGQWQIALLSLVDSSITPLTASGNNVDPVWSSDGSLIYFASDMSGHMQIYVMDADGSNETQLHTSLYNDRCPVIANDTLLFISDRTQTNQVHEMSLDGQYIRQMTFSSGHKTRLTSRSNKAYFSTTEDDGSLGIYALDLDGAVTSVSSDYDITSVRWNDNDELLIGYEQSTVDRVAIVNSSSGATIANLTPVRPSYTFVDQKRGRDETVFSSRYAETHTKTLRLYRGYLSSSLAWLPLPSGVPQSTQWRLLDVYNSSRLVIAVGNDESAALYELDIPSDATSFNINMLTQLKYKTGDVVKAKYASYSQDGSHLVLSGADDEGTDLYIWSRQDQEIRFLPTTPGKKGRVAWCIDRNLVHAVIAYENISDLGHGDIYVYDEKTKKSKQLSAGLTSCSGPVWSPDGSLLAFSSDNKEIRVVSNDGQLHSSIPAINPIVSFLEITDTGKLNIALLARDQFGVQSTFHSFDRKLPEQNGNFQVQDYSASVGPIGFHILSSSTTFSLTPILVKRDVGTMGRTRITNRVGSELTPDYNVAIDEVVFVYRNGKKNSIQKTTLAGEITNLTNGASDEKPRWNISGTSIVFLRKNVVYTMDSDGSNVKKWNFPILITCAMYIDDDTIIASSADGSMWRSDTPNGPFIAVRSSGGVFDIYDANTIAYRGNSLPHALYTKNIQSETVNQIVKTQRIRSNGDMSFAVADSVIFQTFLDGLWQLAVTTLSEPRTVTPYVSSSNDTQPRLNPDGDLAVFVSDETSSLDIFTIDLDTEDRVRLTSGVWDDYEPCWKHTGDKIFFVTEREGRALIYSTALDGSSQARAIPGTDIQTSPDCHPINNKIAYVSTVSNTSQVIVYDLGSLTSITVNLSRSDIRRVRWSSDGTRLLCLCGKNSNECLIVKSGTLTSSGSEISMRLQPFTVDDATFVQGSNTRIIATMMISGIRDLRLITTYTEIEPVGLSASDTEPAFSSDNLYMSRSLLVDNLSQIICTNSDSNATQPLRTVAANDNFSNWSQIGTIIAWHSDLVTLTNASGKRQIWTSVYPSPSPTQLTAEADHCEQPSWRGNTVIFFSQRSSGKYRIAKVTYPGAVITGITTTPTGANDKSPQIAPNGLIGAFIRRYADKDEIWTFNPVNGAILAVIHTIDNVNDITWDDTSSFVYFNRKINNRVSIYRIRVSTQEVEKFISNDILNTGGMCMTSNTLYGLQTAVNTWATMPNSDEEALDIATTLSTDGSHYQSQYIALSCRCNSGLPTGVLKNVSLNTELQS